MDVLLQTMWRRFTWDKVSMVPWSVCGHLGALVLTLNPAIVGGLAVEQAEMGQLSEDCHRDTLNRTFANSSLR